MLIKYLENRAGVYLIINNITKKVYVGSSVQVKKRLNGHFSSLRNNSHHNKYLQRAWNKYGDIFLIKILEYVKIKNNLRVREQFWINFFTSYKKEYGYNNCRIPDITKHFKHSKETKNKISINRSGKSLGINNHFYNKKHSFKTIEKIKSKSVNRDKFNNANLNKKVDNSKIIELYNSGYNANQISKMLNLYHSLVMRRIKWYNNKTN